MKNKNNTKIIVVSPDPETLKPFYDILNTIGYTKDNITGYFYNYSTKPRDRLSEILKKLAKMSLKSNTIVAIVSSISFPIDTDNKIIKSNPIAMPFFSSDLLVHINELKKSKVTVISGIQHSVDYIPVETACTRATESPAGAAKKILEIVNKRNTAKPKENHFIGYIKFILNGFKLPHERK